MMNMSFSLEEVFSLMKGIDINWESQYFAINSILEGNTVKEVFIRMNIKLFLVSCLKYFLDLLMAFLT